MSFMIVNTGRAASRAFHLNLRAQPEVWSCSRIQFDSAVHRLARRRDSDPLEALAHSFRSIGTLMPTAPTFGVVFHDVGKLSKPLVSESNTACLSSVRSALGIDTVFLVVRDPRESLVSELNRELAERAGYWSFPALGLPWKDVFTPAEIAEPDDVPPGLPAAAAHGDHELETMVREISARVGKLFSLYRLFAGVFPNVHVIPYASFVEDPRGVFERIGARAGFRFSETSLLHTKLNGLSNRILNFNPISVAIGPDRRSTGIRDRVVSRIQGRSAVRRPLRSDGRVRFRFEVSAVIPLCQDMGIFEPVAMDCSAQLPQVAKDLGAPVGLGVDLDDVAALAPCDRALARDPRFIEALLAGVAPAFGRNYEIAKSHFRNHVYVDELPAGAFEIYWQQNGDEYQRLMDELAKAPNLVL
jgi:hypothetical protein